MQNDYPAGGGANRRPQSVFVDGAKPAKVEHRQIRAFFGEFLGGFESHLLLPCSNAGGWPAQRLPGSAPEERTL